MAKKFVKTSLATKFRLLFGLVAVGIIAAALLVPWYFLELLAEQGVQRSAAEITRLRLNEHRKDPAAPSATGTLYTFGKDPEGRSGPVMIGLTADSEKRLDSIARQAVKTFSRNPDQDTLVQRTEDKHGRTVYRCFRALRADGSCMDCHRSPSDKLKFESGQLAGIIEMTVPDYASSSMLVWWTRGALLVGGVLAALVAFFLFSMITKRLVLNPVRRLRDIADKVTEGDLAVRSTIKSGDELQRLGDSFNEMLTAISDQHEKLRAANRALDLKLGELAEANVTLFQANQVKSEFLANVSHELRTPLNSIIGFADLVGESQDERVRRYGQNISAAARSLLNMINDLLDLAKIEAGKAEVRFDKVSVTDTCQTLLSLMKPLADKKQLDLQPVLDGDLPLAVTDGAKVQQILYNLLSNAIKFTPVGGQVTLTTSRQTIQRAGAVEEICVSVADTGPGIAEADQQRIFEKFYQLDKSLTKESSGTGLGLAISRELANLLGGRLTLKSSPGHGATFSLIIPTEPPAKPEEPKPPPTAQS